MPVILRKEDEEKWLSDISENQIKDLMKPYDTNDMTAYTVSKLIVSRNENKNTPKIIEKFHYEGLDDI
jgi:putative SOS response-associated peptidase YedK